jgi:DNA polymerase I-like protein with 3'-5' exonuclease and polymerase domains
MNTASIMSLKNTGARLVAMVHDEMVIECSKESIDSVSECVKIAISQVNKEYNLRCKLDCDVQIGNNWSEIH